MEHSSAYRVLSPLQVARVRHEPGVEIAPALAAAEIARLVAAGVIEAVAPTGDTDSGDALPEGGAGEGRVARLRAAIAGLTPGDPDHWTRDGRPEVRALRAASGLADITAGERDAAWAAYPSRRR